MGFPDLVEALLAATEHCRFRLSSMEPETINSGIQKVIAHDRVCPHFHLPIQSGSDRILRLMKRRYTYSRVLEAVDAIRYVKPEAFIAADFIVGFPGEEQKDFEATVDLIEKIRPAKLHVFPFSVRPNTSAGDLEGRVNDITKKNRVRELMMLSESLLESYTRFWQGRILCAIAEGSVSDGGRARGISENYLKLVIEHMPVSQFRSGMAVQCRVDEPGNPSRATFIRALA
jgi:threonylcarbamoyladenosine tRNA methylthiotransferase MtaB